MLEEVTTMTIKARSDFGSIIARAGLTRSQVARVADVSTRTFDALARPEIYDRSGTLRESTAWKIARGFAQLTQQTPDDAFNALFVETAEPEAQP
jgi:hypothetical protein